MKNTTKVLNRILRTFEHKGFRIVLISHTLFVINKKATKQTPIAYVQDYKSQTSAYPIGILADYSSGGRLAAYCHEPNAVVDHLKWIIDQYLEGSMVEYE